MRSFVSTAAALIGLTSLVAATPVPSRNTENPFPGGNVFPLVNGFPNPSPDQLKNIENQALGTLSNAPPPPSVSQEGITNLKLIAFNELFEVAFFTELLFNITTNVPGYEIPAPLDRNFVIATLTAIQGQEELHTLNANTALKHFNVDPILPCQYSFPVSTFDEAITLASTFTSVVLGTLQDVTQIFAQNGDAPLTRGVASVIGQEGEQEGWYRILQSKKPSELPFLTTSVRDFAFTAIQSFTVPGSCPNQNTIPLKTFQPLALLSTPTAATQNLQFQYTTTSDQQLWVTYINQQNLPIVEPLQVISKNGNVVTVEALFPYDANEMNGLTIASLTTSAGPFANADAVATAASFGPALIIIN